MILSGFNTIQVIHTQAVGAVATWRVSTACVSNNTRFNTVIGKYFHSILFVFPSFRSGTRDVRSSSSLRSSATSHPSSHTASGKCCYFITFVFPSLWSGTRDVRSSSSLCSSAASHPSSHTASGRHCCNCLMIQNMGIRILAGFNTASGKCCYFIPFVFPSLRSGTRDVRPSSSLRSSAASHPSSHTASGRHCCNNRNRKRLRKC